MLNPKSSIPTSCMAALAALLCSVSLADDAEFLSRVKADTEWLSSYGTRQIGTPEHKQVQDDLLAKLEAIPNTRVWTDEFPVVVPVHEEAYLEVGAGDTATRTPIFPIWPDVARLNSTGSDGIAGRLVYIGEGEFDDMPAKGLRGQIAVMEMAGYERYRRAFDFGAAAVIFLESERVGKTLPSTQSLYKPRFYVPAGPLADALREGSLEEGRIYCKGSWQTVTARNIYVGVAKEGAEQLPFAMVAPYDSMSRVMGIAAGADVALDAATMLNLLREEAKAPRHSLLFGFIDAYHMNQIGMRRMAATLTLTPDGRTRRAYQEIESEDLAEYQEAAAELDRCEGADDGISRLHDRKEFPQLRRLYKDAVGPALLDLKEVQGDLRLAAKRTDAENDPATRDRMLLALEAASTDLLAGYRSEFTDEQIASLESAHAFVIAHAPERDSSGVTIDRGEWAQFGAARDLAALLVPISTEPLRTRNRILESAYSEELAVSNAYVEVSRKVWDAMADRVRGQLVEQERRLAFFESMDQRRGEMATYFGLSAEDDSALSHFLVGLDLSDCGVIVGPGGMCGYNRIEPSSRDFARSLKLAVKRGELWPEGSPERRFVNIGAIEGRQSGAGYLGHRALISSAAESFLLPGITWVTDDAPRTRVDSPLDRFERLDWSRIGPQIPATRQFLTWIFTTDATLSDPKRVEETSAKWRHGMGRIVDVSAGETVPRVPRAGFLVTLVGMRMDTDGIRTHEFTWTNDDGGFRLPLLCADIFRWISSFNVGAFHIAEDGSIVEALTTTESMVTARLATTFNLQTKPGDQLPRAVTFECVELNGPAFFDARFLEPLKQANLIDTIRGGSPKQAHFSIDQQGQMWGLVDSAVRWQLILRAGAARTRMALLNTIEDGREQGLGLREVFQRGYTIDQPLPSIPEYVAARDIAVLNAWRLEDFRSAGIESEKVDSIRAATMDALAAADAAIEADDGATLKRSAVQALANEIRAYQAVKIMGLDIARGAIFLMLMLVPFCISMERLLFAFPKIGGQISAALGIFTLMTGLLWSFHPAFRISAQPLVIVMAFTILALSVIVISMVLRRFKASVQEFQSTLAEGSGAKMGRGGLVGSAIFLGIANMRKRKVRTLLTGATIVLVTFALLCFSSTSSYIDKKDFELEGLQAKKPAVLIRRPSFGPMSWDAAPALRNQLSTNAVSVGERVWLSGELGDRAWRMNLLNPRTGEQVPVRGALGLPPNEDALTDVSRVLSNWESFAEEGGCYISVDTADLLGVEEGASIVVRGTELVVRGIFEPITFEDEVKILDGQRLSPYDYSQQEQDWVDRDSQDAMEQETGSAAAMLPEGSDSERYIPANELVILPASLLKDFEGTLRSVAIACDSPAHASQVARDLTRTIAYPAYYSNASGGVNVLVSTPLISVPPKNLAIPLIIAALIIFTTMLNSVSERKGEIYVYTSLGLAPSHVAALFIAEALTYGLMGAVFGYVAGQGTASVLTSLGLMEGVTLNYSGTAVIKTMLLVQGVVVLSAIVPAIVAGRVAAPSTEMDWKVPEPVDGVIRDLLPFTVSPAAASGVIAFIHEYLEAHRDGVLGGFDVDQVGLIPRGEDDCVAGLQSRIWLAPFDMGVRQWVRLIVEQPDDGACAIAVEIHHEEGTPKMWWRLNKAFFFDLRRQLLGWRKLSAERILGYVEGSESAGEDAA